MKKSPPRSARDHRRDSTHRDSTRRDSTRRAPSRRRFLRGVLATGAAATVGLPLFDSLLDASGRALAAGGELPRRFGLFFWGNGIRPERWVPAITGPDYVLSAELAPLAAVRRHLTVITGHELKTPNVVTHHSGAAGVLTGQGLEVFDQSNFRYPGPSIDQVLAAQIGGETRFRSVEYGARPEKGSSLTAPETRNPPITRAHELYERFFGDGAMPTTEDGAPDPRLLMRRSVLDAVASDAGRLRATLPSADQQRLDLHLDSVRDLERRLARVAEGGPPPAACVVPDPPSDQPAPLDPDAPPIVPTDHQELSQANRALCDIAALALACDQTRVLSNFFSWQGNDILYDGIPDGHHAMTHHEGGDQPWVHQIDLHIMTELAYMLEALAALPEGDGNLLDNCAVMATSDVSLGRIHNFDEYPMLLAGGAGGRLRQGTHVRALRDNVFRVHLSAMRACGALIQGFGHEDAYTESGLSEIEL